MSATTTKNRTVAGTHRMKHASPVFFSEATIFLAALTNEPISRAPELARATYQTRTANEGCGATKAATVASPTATKMYNFRRALKASRTDHGNSATPPRKLNVAATFRTTRDCPE